MSNNDSRRHLQPEKKYEIVKEVIMGKSPISEVCKKYGINTGQYYKWQQAFLNGVIEGLRHKKNGREAAKEERLIAENQRLIGVIAELASENLQLKKVLGDKGACRGWRNDKGDKAGWILKQIGISKSTYHRWLKWEKPEKKGYVHPLKPLENEEEAVIGYAKGNSGVGYKKLTYQMLDEGVVALSPSQVYRILDREGLLDKWGKTKQEASNS